MVVAQEVDSMGAVFRLDGGQGGKKAARCQRSSQLSGKAAGVMVAYLTGWSLWGINRIPMEVGILGWRLTLIRLASCLVLPPVAGYTAKWIVRFL